MGRPNSARFEEPPADFGLRLIGERRLAAACKHLEELVARDDVAAKSCCMLGSLSFAFEHLRVVETWRLEAGRVLIPPVGFEEFTRKRAGYLSQY